MSHIDLLGYVAGALTTYAFWPQLQKTLTTKSAADVSLGMLTIFTTGLGSGCVTVLCLVHGRLS